MSKRETLHRVRRLFAHNMSEKVVRSLNLLLYGNGQKACDACFACEKLLTGTPQLDVGHALRSGSAVIVAEMGTDIVGCVLVHFEAAGVHLYALCVAKTARGMGIGSSLLHAVHRSFGHLDIDLNVLRIADRSTPCGIETDRRFRHLIPFYQSHGYQIVQRRTQYWKLTRPGGWQSADNDSAGI